MYEKKLREKSKDLICLGTGLIALDIVINKSKGSFPKLWAGGSCGNVLTILSYFGWKSYPIARLGKDYFSLEILKDFKKWKVNLSLISRSKNVLTPIIIENIITNKEGLISHKFERVCPNCGKWLPSYKPILINSLEKINSKLPKSKVFYFDRVSRSSIELAKINKDNGALIVFEPSSVRDEKLFLESLYISDIVKYSFDRLKNARKLLEEIKIPLEIETLGSNGLRFRFSNIKKSNRRWEKINGYTVYNLKDAAGSGDWCTAGIIHLLGKKGRAGFYDAGYEDIINALIFGQLNAALNCYYEGARGAMYNISKSNFDKIIMRSLEINSPPEPIKKNIFYNVKNPKYICPNCKR